MVAVCATGSSFELLWISTEAVSSTVRVRNFHDYSSLNKDGFTVMPPKGDKDDKPEMKDKSPAPKPPIESAKGGVEEMSDSDGELEALEAEAVQLEKDLAKAHKRREVQELKA